MVTTTGKFVLELMIVFVGATAALALENLRQRQEDSKYAADMVAALLITGWVSPANFERASST